MSVKILYFLSVAIILLSTCSDVDVEKNEASISNNKENQVSSPRFADYLKTMTCQDLVRSGEKPNFKDIWNAFIGALINATSDSYYVCIGISEAIKPDGDCKTLESKYNITTADIPSTSSSSPREICEGYKYALKKNNDCNKLDTNYLFLANIFTFDESSSPKQICQGIKKAISGEGCDKLESDKITGSYKKGEFTPLISYKSVPSSSPHEICEAVSTEKNIFQNINNGKISDVDITACDNLGRESIPLVTTDTTLYYIDYATTSPRDFCVGFLTAVQNAGQK